MILHDVLRLHEIQILLSIHKIILEHSALIYLCIIYDCIFASGGTE